jgi:hypothetical protein
LLWMRSDVDWIKIRYLFGDFISHLSIDDPSCSQGCKK